MCSVFCKSIDKSRFVALKLSNRDASGSSKGNKIKRLTCCFHFLYTRVLGRDFERALISKASDVAPLQGIESAVLCDSWFHNLRFTPVPGVGRLPLLR